MKNVVGVICTKNKNIVYYLTNGLHIKKNITVIVQDENLIEFGKVVTVEHPLDESKLNKPLGKIVRIATKKDYQKYKNNEKDAREAFRRCKKLIDKYSLKMTLMDANYTFDRDQLIFRFFSDNRVDFRNLAKELASIYKVRIELRQIGIRDKAKEIGGIGPCGQELCCHRFLKNFASVSISMAKHQNLALNPTKINGSCGRLLCCLKYEDENYAAEKNNSTQNGSFNTENEEVIQEEYNGNY